MLTIRRPDVPQYLRKSTFFLSLNEEDEEEISIPERNFKFNDVVTDETDLRHLLSTLRFWVTEQIPDGLLFYVLTDKTGTFVRVFSEFSRELTYLPILLTLGFTMENLRLSLIAGEGNSQILTYLLRNGYAANSASVQAAARHGHLECLKLLLSAGIIVDGLTCNLAAKNGHLECLTFAHEHGCPFNDNVAVEAAAGGHLDCLKYVHTHGCEWPHTVGTAACRGGSVQCLQYFHRSLPPNVELSTLIRGVDCYAASKGHIDCLRYMHEIGMEWSTNIAMSALMSDQLECLKYVIDNNCVVPVQLIHSATTIESLTYLHGKGYAFTRTAEDFASKGIEMLRFAHEHGCPWSERTYWTLIEAERVDMECFVYAHEHGCPWSEALTYRAVLKESVKVLKYLFKHKCPGAHTDNIRYICENESDED